LRITNGTERKAAVDGGAGSHARFVMMATVVAEPGARAVCAAFTAAMAAYGVSSEVLTDNGKQFTRRFTKPYPAEVLFERVCREDGITTRLTKPRSPTTDFPPSSRLTRVRLAPATAATDRPAAVDPVNDWRRHRPAAR
jgi:hypothetical protein